LCCGWHKGSKEYRKTPPERVKCFTRGYKKREERSEIPPLRINMEMGGMKCAEIWEGYRLN
jgi:hypothetical protein